MVKCCGEVSWWECCGEVLWWQCRGEVLRRSVVKECCREVL